MIHTVRPLRSLFRIAVAGLLFYDRILTEQIPLN